MALILSAIFIKMGTAVKADRPIWKVLSFHQVANTHRNVCVKFESNGPRRLSRRNLTRMCTVALILRTISLKLAHPFKLTDQNRPEPTFLSFHQVASTHLHVCAKFESKGPWRLSCRTLTKMCTMALILRTIFTEIGTAV